ncbi:MAG: nuclear transport factor 2 family protein [Peptostreptococcaceae bacterium]|nr:nuclear transport factor 2 family protein [Peptostreptococcaceae bacterium]
MQERLRKFFEAENKRDWESYRQFLHPQVRWRLFGAEEKRIEGVEEYMRVMKSAYEGRDTQFVCQKMEVSDDGRRIAAHLLNDQGERSLDIFDFKEGRIYREYEFLMSVGTGEKG